MKQHTSSPLALRFEEALVPSQFVEQIRLSSETQIRRQLRENSNSVLRPAINSGKFVMERRGIQVVIKGGIPKGAKLMQDKAGRLLPVVVDGKTGRTLKQARVVGRAGTAAKAGATALLAVVEAAHVISGHDNAKRLKKVELGVDRLLQAQETELRARLEAIYRHSKELLHLGLDDLLEEDRRELHRHGRELIELRARWRDEFYYRLQRVDKADPHWVNKLFFWRRRGAEEKARRRKSSEATAGLQEVQLMHFSLMLQMTLSGAAGRMDGFRSSTLPDECQIWIDLHNFAQLRVKEIAGGSSKEFRPFLNALKDMAAVWSASAARHPTNQIAMEGDVEKLEFGEAEGGTGEFIEGSTHFVIAWPQADGDKVSDGYVLKVHFAKRLGNDLTREDLLDQFIVKVDSEASGKISEGVELPRHSYRINYNETRDCHALGVPLPSLSNGASEYGIEATMRRPIRDNLIDSGCVYRAVRFVRS